MQPTGGFTLGNYIGAIKQWPKLQDDCDCIYCVVDMHALTIRSDPALFRKQTLQSAAVLIACGLDPDRTLIYIQSHVAAHAQLSWVLSCYTQFGELSRMTQFKDKSKKHPENINAGLFTYPVLMAADILLFGTDLVPIGDDQKQHMEIARDIAIRFNGIYGDVFKIPEGYYPKVGARVMSLQEPSAKMSKSDENENAKVMLLDEPDTIIRKFKRAVTDSGSEVRAADDKPGVTNLMTIYGSLTGKTLAEVENDFKGKGYGDFKLAVGETVADALSPIQAQYRRIIEDRAYLDEVLKTSAERAGAIGARTLNKVYKKIGFVV